MAAPGAVAPGSRRRCGWYCEPRLSRLNTCPLFSHWIFWRQAPGAAGGSRGGCCWPVAGGAQRTGAQSCSNPSRSEVQAKRIAPFAGLSPLPEDVARRKGKRGSNHVREGELFNHGGGRVARVSQSLPSNAKGGLQTLPSKGGCWDVALASFLFPSSGRRRGAARRPQRTAVSGVKEGGEILNFLAHLQSYTSRSGPAAPPLFVHVMRLETCKADSSLPLPLPPLPVVSSSPQTRCTGNVKGKEQNGTHILRHTRLNLGRTCRNFKRLRQAKAARPWGEAKICTKKNAIKSPARERREVRRWGGCWGRESGRGKRWAEGRL